MNNKLYICLVLLFVTISSCKDKSEKVDMKSSLDETKQKDISELTYQEIFYLLHNENEFGVDFHGDSFGQEAAAEISLITKSGMDCGDAIALESSATDNTVQVAVKTTFRFPNNPANEIVRIYKVKPGETVPVGHNKLCYDGNDYAINREIVSAGFTNEE